VEWKRKVPANYIEVLPKWHIFYLFQNVACCAISVSKFTCNSNISIITDGPVGQYQFKYVLKPTQEDDTAAYSLVEESIKSLQSRVHEDNKKEAVRLICHATFAHNKGNVIGASFALFLTRHDSRFYFSHKFQYCPLKDLQKALNGSYLSGVLKYGKSGGHYFENQALHYLCLPKDLEELSPYAFFEKYQTVDIPLIKKRNRHEPDLRFIVKSKEFQHPSVSKRDPDVCCQGVLERT
jgi:hypothetical protein